jgi:hypothetical protein
MAKPEGHEDGLKSPVMQRLAVNQHSITVKNYRFQSPMKHSFEPFPLPLSTLQATPSLSCFERHRKCFAQDHFPTVPSLLFYIDYDVRSVLFEVSLSATLIVTWFCNLKR